MKASALKNRTVVSMDSGQQIGRVADVLFETTELRVSAFAVATSGGPSILPFAAARIGPDAITVQNMAASQMPAEGTMESMWRPMAELTKLRVVSSDGMNLGEVQDASFDDQSGRLTELDVRRGGVLGLGASDVTVSVASIRSIGPDLVTVDMTA